MLTKYFRREKKPENTIKSRREDNSTQVFNREYLSTLTPFDHVQESTLILAMSFAQIIELGQNLVLFDNESDDAHDYYLIQGAVKIIADDGRESLITSGTARALKPLAYLRPIRYKAITKSITGRFLKLPHNFVESIFEQAKKSSEWDHEEIVVIGHFNQETLLEKVQREIERGALIIPTLPEVAEKVRIACEDAETKNREIAYIISYDTSIATKLIAASNSALYKGLESTSTIEDAISRLGRNTTKSLVFYYSSKELFETPSSLLRQLFYSSWEKSLERAILAKIIAVHVNCNLNPDTAFLCGLLFRLGDLVTYQYVSEFVDDVNELSKVQNIAEKYSVKITEKILNFWKIPTIILESIKNGGNWLYDSEQEIPNYCDVLITANVHLRMLSNNIEGMPGYRDIPALAKVMTNDFAPGISIISEFHKALAEFKAL